MNHLVVANKTQLRHALLAGAYPTYAEARANPFSIEMEGTRCRVTFPNGLHEDVARSMVAYLRRTPAACIQPTRG